MLRTFLAAMAATCLSAANLLVTVDTTALPAGSYYLDYQFGNGDAAYANNQIYLSQFSSTGGLTYAHPATLDGWATNPVAGEYQLIDDDPSLVPAFFNGVLLSFSSTGGASSLTFLLSSTNVYAGPGFADTFTMAILNDSFFSTRESGGFDAPILQVLLDGSVGGPQVTVWASNVAPYDGVPAPEVADGDVPEVSTYGLIGAGLLAMTLGRRKMEAAHVA